MKIKMILKFSLTPVRITIIKKTSIANAGENEEKKESLYSVERECKLLYSHCGNQHGGLSETI
jgi:hypothetical protein